MKKNAKGLYTSTFTYDSKRYYVRARTIQELQKRVAQRRYELEAGYLVVNSALTVAKWAVEWLETYKRTRVRQASYDRYKSDITRHLIKPIGNMKIADVRPIHLQRVMNDLAGLSEDRLKKIAYTMRAIFDRARQNGVIITNPADSLELPQAADPLPRRSITDRERRYILALAHKHDAGLWIKMLLYCGLRPGETIPLQWSHIDLNTFVLGSLSKALENGLTAGFVAT